jgi:hypothetical protein
MVVACKAGMSQSWTQGPPELRGEITHQDVSSKDVSI